MKKVTTVANDMQRVVDGVRKAVVPSFGTTYQPPVSKHAGSHAGEKQRRKERTRAKNRTARTSRRVNR